MIRRIVIIDGVNWEERTHEALRDSGHRLGAARQKVVSVLARGDCCLTVPEIVDAVRARGGGVGIASVYRVLDLLSEKQLVQKIDLGDGRARYERAELADALDVSRQTVDAIETGKFDPSLPLAFRAARLFGPRIEEIFHDQAPAL